MRHIVGIGWVATAFVVAAWRGAAELVARRRALVATGELDMRIAARRRQRIDAALVRAGLLDQRVLAPVRVIVGERTHAAVHVGAVRPGDLDDVGLLEAAMRRTARQRGVAVVAPIVDEPAVDRTDWGSLIEQPQRIDDALPPTGALPAWAVPAALVAVAVTVVSLVRPLGDGAPWLALAGLSIAGAAWLVVRRR